MDPWARYITHLGEVRVKHKIIVDIYNLYGRLDGPFCGNPGTPKRVIEDGRARSREAKALRPRFSDVMRPHWGRIFALMFIGGLAGSTAPTLLRLHLVHSELLAFRDQLIKSSVTLCFLMGFIGEEVFHQNAPPWADGSVGVAFFQELYKVGA